MIVGMGAAMPFRLAAGSSGGGSELHVVEPVEDRLLGDPHREGDRSVPVAPAELESIGATRYIRHARQDRHSAYSGVGAPAPSRPALRRSAHSSRGSAADSAEWLARISAGEPAPSTTAVTAG